MMRSVRAFRVVSSLAARRIRPARRPLLLARARFALRSTAFAWTIAWLASVASWPVIRVTACLASSRLTAPRR